MSRNFGYVYVATGIQYIEEAIQSIDSMRQIGIQDQVCLFCDEKSYVAMGTRAQTFNEVIFMDNVQFNFHDKIRAMIRSPYQVTAFVDTDIRFIRNPDLIKIGDKYDLAFCWDPIRHDYELEELPEWFPTPNTGVLVYKNKPSMIKLLEDWLVEYEIQLALPKPPLHDQPAFRHCLYNSDLKFLVLPDEYNLRIIFPHMVGGNTKIKLLHGRHQHLENAMEYSETLHFFPRVYGRTYSTREIVGLVLLKMRSKFNLRGKKRRGVMHKA